MVETGQMPTLLTSLDGPAVERDVVVDMVRRAGPGVISVLVLASALVWGVNGALSSAFAAGLAVGNLALSAILLAGAARISLFLFGAAALGGFVLRLGLVTAAVLLVKDQAWVELVPLSFTLVLTHLVLLVAEARHISASLAFPGVKPVRDIPR